MNSTLGSTNQPTISVANVTSLNQQQLEIAARKNKSLSILILYDEKL